MRIIKIFTNLMEYLGSLLARLGIHETCTRRLPKNLAVPDCTCDMPVICRAAWSLSNVVSDGWGHCEWCETLGKDPATREIASVLVQCAAH